MFLKSVTLRGFKSFADKTVLDFEPGVTVLVGPNGSGKSNVVDALAWVLGTRSAKLLRGGELTDVIFAGSPVRPPLHHAKVEITIDNSAGRLAAGAAGLPASMQAAREVRISREILASGETHYAINGAECRLLDVQELLSDTGLGRELHTIVGQGQLDAVLYAKPEDRRAFIEEAAGILKHRRRRERALSKLESVDVHMDKLRSLLRELRRQLKPLEQQAEAASTYAQLQAELREVEVKLAVHDLARLREQQREEAAAEAAISRRAKLLQAEAAQLQTLVADLAPDLRRHERDLEEARSAAEQLARLEERLGGTADLIEARRRYLLNEADTPLAGRPPAALHSQADRLDADRAAREQERRQAAVDLEAATVASRDAQLAWREHERRVASTAREAAEARERRLRWEAEVSSHRSALAAAEAEAARVRTQLAELDRRVSAADEEIEAVQERIRRLDAQEWPLAEAHERAAQAVAGAEADLESAVAQEQHLERERTSQLARAEAIRSTTTAAGDGAAALLRSELDGVLGLVADHVHVRHGAEAAVAAALGPLAGAVVARSHDHARAAVAHLRATGGGRTTVLPAPADGRPPLQIPAGTRAVADLMEARDAHSVDVVNALRAALRDVFLAETWSQAVAAHLRSPELTFVTRHGDVAGPRGFSGGAEPEPSAVLALNAADLAERRGGELGEALRRTRGAVAAARRRLAARRADLAAATAALNESDARITGAAEQLGRASQDREALLRQRDPLASQQTALRAAATRHRSALQALEASCPPLPHPPPTGRDAAAAELEAALERARQAELATRLRVERLDEQLRHLHQAAGDLRREAAEVEAALQAAARRRERRRRDLRRCELLAEVCVEARRVLRSSVTDAEAARDHLAARRSELQASLERARGRLRELDGALAEIGDERHAADLRRADTNHRLAEVEGRLRDAFGLSPDEALGDHPDAAANDRASLESARAALAGKIEVLGLVNPLAMEAFRALEERHRFLARQLQDLQASRRDLEAIIRAVDGRIREVFAEAFADVAREFSAVFAALFPGGQGQLRLTDPGDLLHTGIEVDARPPGKRIRRLSLLSGGERALSALALLFAIFRARPSPFYVLDEVEATLDDVNLERLLGIIESFKQRSQLLIVTHQQRTMEIADVLYGVTMGGDAVSKVVSERLREPVGG